MSQYNQNDQNVNSQFNVGRDQIIHNLVLVGQFLDFTKIEGLIPKSSAPADFNTIVDAFEKTFSTRVETDLAQSVVFAGEVLKDAIKTWSPTLPFQALPIRDILHQVPTIIANKLVKLNYWNAYHESGDTFTYMRLQSLSLLWNKHFHEELVFAIAYTGDRQSFLVYVENKINAPIYWNTNNGLDVDSITYEKFRVIMAGLIIDLMRIHSIGVDDVKFWNGIVGLISK